MALYFYQQESIKKLGKIMQTDVNLSFLQVTACRFQIRSPIREPNFYIIQYPQIAVMDKKETYSG